MGLRKLLVFLLLYQHTIPQVCQVLLVLLCDVNEIGVYGGRVRRCHDGGLPESVRVSVRLLHYLLLKLGFLFLQLQELLLDVRVLLDCLLVFLLNHLVLQLFFINRRLVGI